MKTQTVRIQLNRQGVDTASATIQNWLEAAGVQHKDVLRIRLTMEEMFSSICDHGKGEAQAELRYGKWLGDWQLLVRYDGDRYDPTEPRKNELDGWKADLLARTGFVPAWHWKAGQNELLLQIPTRKKRTELVLLGCLVTAILIGFLGQFFPENFKTAASEYVLSFLSNGFLNLLNTFIGLMIFLSIITGICGIGSAKSFGRIGKLMISRFVISTFIICAVLSAAVRIIFPLSGGEGGISFRLQAILEMIFGIIPSNPIKPFLEGNTLQIVFLAAILGVVLLLTRSETEGVRSLVFQLHTIMTRCVTAVCMFLPIFILSSLIMMFWKNGTKVILHLWKPLVLCIVLYLILTAVYLVIVCRKLKVRASVLLPKLMPDFLIALSTSSSSAAFATSIEINETKLGIDSSYSRTAVPIGGILFAGSFSLVYVLPGAFLAEYYGVKADFAWWIILWLVCSLLAMATPPVPGGMISCLSILILQLQIPEEGLILGTTLAMLMDFFCSSFRIMFLHFELLLQADRLDLLDREILRKKG